MKGEKENIKELCGRIFDRAAVIAVCKLVFRSEVREMCKSGRCGSCDRNWGCPPSCGSVDRCRRRAEKYEKGIVVQTIGLLEDSFDYEGMERAAEKHHERMTIVREKLESKCGDILPLGAGPCRVCGKCTCPDEPCRFPQKRLSSMEAYGLMVREVCEECGLEYINGKNTVTYTGCFLIKE